MEELRIGELILHPRVQLLRHGRPLAIGGRALDLLTVLASARGEVVSKDRLIADVWDGAIVEENAIQAQVSALRKTLGDEARRLITIHRRGYRLDLDGAALELEAKNSGTASVAVLPFDNLSDNPANGYLADGLAEELIAVLSRIPDLKVSARISSFAYRGKQIDARTIGGDLAVARLVEGSVRVSGNHVRATLQLIDTATGLHLWARNFDREMTDLFALQDDIAAAVASELETELIGGGRPTRDLEAYQLYLQARALLDRWDRATVLEGVSLFRRAIERDPSFTLASIGLATILIGASAGGLLPLSVRQEARALTEQAARDDPRSCVPPIAIGCLAALRGDWSTADGGFRASLALDPHEPYSHFAQAHYLLAPCGHIGQARTACEKAFALAPAVALFSLGRTLMAGLHGDGTELLQRLQMAETLGVSHDDPALRLSRATFAFRLGKWEEAAEHVSAALPTELRAQGLDASRLVYRACLGLADKSAASAAAERLLAACKSDAIQSHAHTAFEVLVTWQVMLGNLDAAFEVLSHIVEGWRRTGHLATLSLMGLWSFQMRALRAHPRFSDFLGELGMFDYWERHGPPDGHELCGGRLVVL